MKNMYQRTPIAFSADMVRYMLLQGWKTQTSRTRGLRTVQWLAGLENPPG